jgi:hypothetical protein
MQRTLTTIALAGMLLLATGCQRSGRIVSASTPERFGKTFYLDGAGNWGWGQTSVGEGLRRAGYRGDVEVFLWTTSLNPIIDQLNIVAAKLRARQLAGKIEDYHRRYPDSEINIVALSAGTGVATWAIENLNGGAKINNFAMLGSSLSHSYDVRRALTNMTGSIFVFYSRLDGVLPHTLLVGTIDGRRGVKPAGLIGLDVPPGAKDRVINIAWTEDAKKFGWQGGHVDTTNPVFVANEIAPRILVHHETGLNNTTVAARSNQRH